MTDEQALIKLYGEMWRALLTKNISALEELHADEFVLTHMTGLNQPRAEYFRCVRDGKLNYFSETPENIFVEVSGNDGRLIGRSRVTANLNVANKFFDAREFRRDKFFDAAVSNRRRLQNFPRQERLRKPRLNRHVGRHDHD